MIREDRELFAELARLNTEMAPLAMRMLEGSASTDEQQCYALRLIAVGERLRSRADQQDRGVVAGEVLFAMPSAAVPSVALPPNTAELD